ncbi:MAG: hypothetical protein ABFS86_01620 [Planctomycetota bacterium]
MKHLEKLTRKHLGELLLDDGLISKSQLDDAESEHKRTGNPLGPILVDAGYISDWDLAKAVATQYQLPFVELATVSSAGDFGDTFRPDEQSKHRFIPLDSLGTTITLAVADMPDIEFLRGVRDRTGQTPFLFVTLLSEIQRRLEDTGVVEPVVAEAAEDAEDAAVDLGPEMELMPDDPDEDIAQGLSIFDEGEAKESLESGEGDGWKSIFDSANESVLNEIDQE